MLSVKSDRPVDALTIAVSRAVDRVIRELELPYFLAGAMARDIWLTHVFGIDIRRATRDVDFGVAVRDWKQFELIKERLIASGQFSRDEKRSQRVLYKTQGVNTGYPVDIIPFGGVEAPPLLIAWPPENKEVMNVVGYDEALATAMSVTIENDFSPPVVSLPGLALLKLFAWQDRHAVTPKDAQDLAILFRNYHAAGNQERFYEEEFALLQAVEFDVDLAGPRLLGKDVRQIASEATLMQASTLLSNAQKVDRLVTHMSVEFRAEDDSTGAAERLLQQFKIGLTQE